MDIEKNILLAKKHIVENIYSSVRVEGLAITFPETEQILEDRSVKGRSHDELYFVNDLKHAWQYLLENVSEEIGIETVRKMNRLAGRFTVDNAGSIRSVWSEPIAVYGMKGELVYTPPVPKPAAVLDGEIRELCALPDKTDAALELYMYIAKSQLFNDGNKRTASLICNMALIQNGEGLFIIPPEKSLEFKTRLIDFYTSGKGHEFKEWLRGNCILKPKEYTLGQKIQMLRERLNLSRAEFAAMLNVSEETVLDIEKDRAEPPDEAVEVMADYFGIDKEEFKSDAVSLREQQEAYGKRNGREMPAGEER